MTAVLNNFHFDVLDDIVNKHNNTVQRTIKMEPIDFTSDTIVGLIKKHCIKMNQYFPKPFRSFGGNINVKVDLSNYATKADQTLILQILH